VDGREGLESFLLKWHARWPEWRVAEAFLPVPVREPAAAWMSLRQELADAAWGGSDPRPGEAKLAWWTGELHGWMHGEGRHPLARVLQPLPAPWDGLSAALAALADSRERASDFAEGRLRLDPYARALAAVGHALHGHGQATDADADADAFAHALQAQRLLGADPGAVPLQILAALGTAAAEATARREAVAALLRGWRPVRRLPRTDALHQALLRARLRRVAGGADAAPLPAWRALALSWQAARRSIPPA
jgi:phytoene/squalene synthetase